MKNINELMKSLNKYFGWNKFRIECFAQMLLGLISVRTVRGRSEKSPNAIPSPPPPAAPLRRRGFLVFLIKCKN